jgi:hypothetical protein
MVIALAMELIFGWLLWYKIKEIRASNLSDNLYREFKLKEFDALVKKNVAVEAGLQALNTGQAKVENQAPLDSPKPRKFMDRFNEALKSPVFQKLLTKQQRARLDSIYGDLFRKLNLTPEQSDRFKDLLVQKETAKTDAMLANRGEGVTATNDPDDLHSITIEAAQKDVDDQINSLLGNSGYAQYQHYEETSYARSAVNEVSQALRYTSTPLTEDQTNNLVEAWYQSLPAGKMGNTQGPSAQFAAGLSPAADREKTIPDSSLEASRSVLSPEQLAVVAHLMSIQKARQRISELSQAPAP